ncbi:S-formylglutathione hydrolase [Vibrio vulnificus]|uniref:S-formylglutathione hydrolase n=1 Tax=Vibrio vulnificus TaxID=672 RepID=UPI000CD24C63|nr:S-formylglutathione hydrolase [Vibrio vulnificus]AVW99831.1 S-formylglutathione hydrolase [Vibrio vulnificus Env1]POC69435.1 S-formylglutathione hydrolase [Vibrio vulnificus Env1]
MVLTHLSQSKVFQGWYKQYQHHSSTLNCEMRFAIFLPPQATNHHKVPVLYWLSGLTCSDENFMQKAAAFEKAAELGMAIVAPDTSPRGEGVADDPDGHYDLGLGAGFYLNATQTPWKKHYQMYDYIVSELPQLIEANFPVTEKRAIAGHSMGGHGALTIGIRNPDRYCSISAFSPICHPTKAPWGQKAFRHYLGEETEQWAQYDAVELLKEHCLTRPLLVDQGAADPFLEEQLQIETLQQALQNAPAHTQIRLQPGYDHSYFFIQSFIADHLAFHWQHLST